MGEGIAGDPAQEADFVALGVISDLDPFHQRIQAVGITKGIDLGCGDLPSIAGVLVLVDGGPQPIQRKPQVAFVLAPYAEACYGYGHHGQHHQDGERHDQFHQGQSALGLAFAFTSLAAWIIEPFREAPGNQLILDKVCTHADVSNCLQYSPTTNDSDIGNVISL